MAPKKSPAKGASPTRKSPKKGASPPKKTRQSPSKAKAAAIEAEIAAEEPSQRVTRGSPAKKGQSSTKSPRKTASPTKVTKSKSPSKPAAKAHASPAKGKDTRFRGAPEESSHGYKAEESSEDIIKAIDGRKLTKLDKILVAAIHDLESPKSSGKTKALHETTARDVACALEVPYSRGEEPREKAHFNIYWRFRTLIEDVIGEWPSELSAAEMEDSDDEGSESGVVDDGGEAPFSRARHLPATSAVRRGAGSVLNEKQSMYLDRVKAAARESYMTRGRYDSADAPKYDRIAMGLKISREDFQDAVDKGTGSAIRALPAETALQKYGTNSGQPMLPQGATGGGITRTPRGQKPDRPITQGTPSPQKSVDPHQAAKDKAQREAKRAADVKARKALLANEEAYPPNKSKGIPHASKRGTIVSSTNPGIISVMFGGKKQERVNPFFETLPGPEVWFRNMPPFFSFGETKLMEQIISDQINVDLARKHDEVGTVVPGGKSKEAEAKPVPKLRKDQWALPELTEAEENAILAEVRKQFPNYKGTPSKKRTHPASQTSPRKR